jgi:hypothetical protein
MRVFQSRFGLPTALVLAGLTACFNNSASRPIESANTIDAVIQNGLCISPDKQLVAIPLGKNCLGLTLERDFFDPSIYGNNAEFIPALRKVAIALRNGASGKRALATHHIDASMVEELLRVQMAGLSYMRLSSGEFDYEFRFRLSNVKLVGLLSESGRVEFARVIE